MSQQRLCVVVPTLNHVDALDAILTRTTGRGLPTIVVDDGSRPEVGERIRDVCERHPDAEYQRHPFNGGKGFAVMCGIARAQERGFTHAVQIDSDGQHDLDSLDALLAASRLNPDAIVTGVPIFDRTVPLARRIGKPITTFWVHVNTLSTRIRDAMCGFRVYPVEATLNLVRESVRGRRMDFDVEILVKAYWARIGIVSVPVRVAYPESNFSNFNLLRDNLLLSWLQTKLFFGMLVRFPTLLFRRLPRPRLADEEPARWSTMAERGSYLGMRLIAGVYRLFGRTICLTIMAPVVFYFFVTGRAQREASRDYLMHLWRSGYLRERPSQWTSFRHFMNFAASSLDTLAAWTGRIPEARVLGPASRLLSEVEAGGKGAFVITAHLGNPEVIRAVAVLNGHVPINVLMHIEHAQFFNRLIREFSPNAPVRAIPVTKVGADTAIALSEAVARGEWVVMVGDRVPVVDGGRVVDAPFLGDLAPLPQGPYILGALLKVPTYLMFCVRGRHGYDVHFSKFADRIELPRGDRMGAIARYAALFAKALEARVAEAPFQWFNFYSFWSAPRDPYPDVSVAQKAAE